MAAAKRYQVAAKMAVVRVPGAQGGESYVRQGRLLPTTVEKAEIERLLGRGLIEAVEVAEAEDATPADGANGGSGEQPPPPPAKPGPNAKVETWTAYAADVLGLTVPDGADRDAVKALVTAHEAQAQQ